MRAGKPWLARLPHTLRIPGMAAVLAASLQSGSSAQPQLLPHRQQMAAGVHAAGFSHQFGNSNCGWIALGDHTLLVDLPRGTPVPEFLSHVSKVTGKPAKRLVLTHLREDPDWAIRTLYAPEKGWYDSGRLHPPDAVVPIIEALVAGGVNEILASPKIHDRLTSSKGRFAPARLRSLRSATPIGDASRTVEFLPLDREDEGGAGAVFLPAEKVLFGGPAVFNGTHTMFSGKDTRLWIEDLERLDRLAPQRVVPGFGSWGGREILGRLRSLLSELRSQVAHGIAEGYSLKDIQGQVRIPVGLLYWTPYTKPGPDDIAHVFRELTVPSAPYYGPAVEPAGSRPHALVLIGDTPHPPEPIQQALAPMFERAGVVAHFTVDVTALSAENLRRVRLLVILRDGRQVPRPELRVLQDPLHGTIRTWMTLEQEQAVVSFVEKGGSFLNLHNSLGLYPPDGPYLKLVGGRYIGHGPYERFRVEVADPAHPVTQGVTNFTIADEQHTPVLYDEGAVHLVLRSRMDNGTAAPAGWVREVGGGRICHLASGHPVEPLRHPMYQRLLQNAVEWCLRRR